MKKAKILSLLLAGSLLFNTAGIEALATAASEPVLEEQFVEAPDDESSEESGDVETSERPSEEETDKESEDEQNPEQSSEKEEEKDDESSGETETPEQSSGEEGEKEKPSEETEEPSEETEEPDVEDASLDETEDSEDSVSENTISENTLSEEEPEEEDVFAIFPGLGDSYTLSSTQMADKRVLAAHVSDILSTYARNAGDYPDADGIYELGEVVYLAETAEEAEQVAAAFGGDVDSYAYGVAVISLPKKATVTMAVAAAADPDMKLPAVWPNYYNYLTSDVNEINAVSGSNDPELGTQWQHDYIGTSYAWAAGYKGQNVKVAVIDTGLKVDHEDLSANAEAGRDFVGTATGGEKKDDNGTHGTHVAGIIAADDNNNKGGAGIAPDAQVKGYCVLNKEGSGTSADIMRAVDAAVEDGNDIINMSLGGSMYNAQYEETIANAYKNGVAVFVSAGNEDTDGYSFPAVYNGAISVGAVDQNSARAAFSNYGSTVKLSFPGVHIYSTIPSGYGYMSGTSQAAPAAAGTAAVILSANETIRNKEGKARVDALLSAMKSSTTKCSNSGMGAGTTWLPGVLKIATDTTVPDAPTITIAEKASDTAGKTYIAKEITATLSTKTAVGVEIYYTTDGKSPSYKNGQIVVGQKYTGAFKVDGAKNKTIKAIAVNPITGKVSKVASKACVLTPIPEGVTVTAANGVSKIAASKSVKLTATVTPSYAISNKVEWTVVDTDNNDAKDKGVTVSNGTVKAAKTAAAGTYTVKATAVGSDGKKFDGAVGTYEITVLETSDIKTVAFIDGTTTKAFKAQSLNTKATLDLKEYLVVTKTDNSTHVTPEADTLVVWSSSNTNIATVANGVITAKTPGKAVIKATSNDGGNKSASFTVTVNQPIEGITLSGPNNVAAGKGITLTAAVTPSNATNKKLDWKVEGNDKVTVSASGKVTAKKDAEGTCKVTATAKDGSGVSSADYTITIKSGEITKITLSERNVTLFAPNTSTNAPTEKSLTAEVDGKEGADTSLIEWKSSASSIATVDQNGKITAKSAGKATITCASTDGSNKKATCTVNVTVPMSKLSIGPADSYGDYYEDLTAATGLGKSSGYLGYIAQGKSIKMSAKYSSNYGTPTNKKVTWTSSNENVLTVDKNGKVTANKDAIGEYATITATAADGSKVVSNEYNFRVMPLYKKLVITQLYLDAFCVDAIGDYYGNPTYFTVSVSGGKNTGLAKEYDEKEGCYLISPIPSKATTTKSLAEDSPDWERLTTKDAVKMTITVKLRDGSGLTAKHSFWAVRDGKNNIAYLYTK